MTEIAVGSVGAGFFGRLQIEAWSRVEGARVVAVADPDLGQCAAAPAPRATRHADLDALLDAHTLDVLDIATPPGTHAGLVLAALGRVPLVICQKPFCTGLAQAEAVADRIAGSATRVVVHENFRFQPWYRAIRDLVRAGALGSVRDALFRLRPGDGQGAEAYLARQPYFREMPRLLIRETGVHWIDIFRFLFGEPEAVDADLRRLNPAIAGEDAGRFTLRYPDGLRATFDGNRLIDHAAADRRLTMGEMWVEGDAAVLRLCGDGRLWVRRHGANHEEEVPVDADRGRFGGDCIRRLQAHIAGHIVGDGPLENEAGDYLANLRLEEAVYRAAAAGRVEALA